MTTRRRERKNVGSVHCIKSIFILFCIFIQLKMSKNNTHIARYILSKQVNIILLSESRYINIDIKYRMKLR